MRRVSLALLASVGMHVAIVLAAVGVAAWRGLSFARNVEVVPITIQSVRELPLGAPPVATRPSSEPIVAPPPHRPRIVAHKSGTVPTEHRDAGAPADALAAAPPPEPAKPATARKPGDLRSYLARVVPVNIKQQAGSGAQVSFVIP